MVGLLIFKEYYFGAPPLGALCGRTTLATVLPPRTKPSRKKPRTKPPDMNRRELRQISL